MPKPIIIHEYSTARNKFKSPNKLPNYLKKQLIIEKGMLCYVCNKLFDRSYQLEFEHKIPVEVGGHLFERYNVDLICRKCHTKKTRIDIKTINMLKKSKIIQGHHFIRSFFTRSEVIKFFIEFRKIIEEIQIKEQIYNFGTGGSEYIQHFDESNRIENG